MTSFKTCFLRIVGFAAVDRTHTSPQPILALGRNIILPHVATIVDQIKLCPKYEAFTIFPQSFAPPPSPSVFFLPSRFYYQLALAFSSASVAREELVTPDYPCRCLFFSPPWSVMFFFPGHLL